MRYRRVIVLAALGAVVLARGLCAEPASAQTAFYRANEAYKHQRYADAISEYQAVLSSGMGNGVVYYNLGNALVKDGRKGEALWAYLKAAQWMPGDADLQANLSYVRSVLPSSDAVSVKTPQVIQWLVLQGAWTTRQLFLGAAVLIWLALIAWVIVGWWPASQRASTPAAWLISLFACVAVVALMAQTFAAEGPARAVVIRNNAEVRFAPQESGTVHFSLAEGAVIRLLTQDHGWSQVRRADGLTGWVMDSSLKPL